MKTPYIKGMLSLEKNQIGPSEYLNREYECKNISYLLTEAFGALPNKAGVKGLIILIEKAPTYGSRVRAAKVLAGLGIDNEEDRAKAHSAVQRVYNQATYITQPHTPFAYKKDFSLLRKFEDMSMESRDAEKLAHRMMKRFAPK